MLERLHDILVTAVYKSEKWTEIINLTGALTRFARFLCMADRVTSSGQARDEKETALCWRERAGSTRRIMEETHNIELQRLLDKLAQAFEALSNADQTTGGQKDPKA